MRILIVGLCFSLGVFGAGPAIGVVTASGHFILERSEIWGNATVFDGSTIETRAASSELALASGVRLQLAANSRARVWSDHAVLERGASQASGNYRIEARGLTASGDARMRVALAGESTVEVAALAGAVRVADANGTLVTAVPTGKAVSLEPQEAGTSMTRTGCLVYKSGRYILQDDNTGEVVELTGQNLSEHVGNRIELTGVAAAAKPMVADAKSVMNVLRVTPKTQGGCLSVASALNAQASAPAGAQGQQPGKVPAPKKGGMSTGAKVALIGGIAGGGAGGALAAARGKKSTSP